MHCTIHILLPELPLHYMSPVSPAAGRLPPCPCLESEIESHHRASNKISTSNIRTKFQPQISAQDCLYSSLDG